MKLLNRTRSLRWLAVLGLLLALGGVDTARAQFDFRWLSAGDFQHRYNGGLGQPEIYAPFPMMVWPGIYNITSAGGVSYMHVMGYWISAKNLTDEQGKHWDVRTSHSGPRALGIGEFFQTDMRLISQFEAPSMTVDGNETYQVPVVIDEVDSGLLPDRMLLNKVNTSIGVSVEQRSIQFSNPYHDDYHITEFRFVNTGNMDRDEEIEVEQRLEDVYFSMIRRPKTSASSTSWDNSEGAGAWGAINETDIIGNGEQDYGLPADWRGEFTWLRHGPGKNEYSTIGGPMWVPGSWWYAIQTDTTGRLGAAGMHGEFILRADGGPHNPDPDGLLNFTQPDDPSQPFLMTYMHSDDSDLTGNSNHNDVATMAKEREWIERGVEVRSVSMPPEWLTDVPNRTVPAQPFVTYPVTGGGDVDFVNHFATTAPPANPSAAGSWSYGNNFGPFDMEPGQEVRVVLFDGVGGLSDELAVQLGQWYRGLIKRRGMTRDDAGAVKFHWNPTVNQTCTEGSAGCVSLTKDQWVMTCRDSLFQLVRRAKAALAAGYHVPSPPKPPSSFAVTSGTDKISLAWTPTEQPAGGWEFYRTQNRFQGFPAPYPEERYVKIATLPASQNSYEDTNVQRNISYFYYLQAVGGPNNVDPDGINGTPGGVPLKSSRYYAQTYDPAFLKRAPGSSLSAARIVPNPYNLGASQNLRWPDQQNKIAFLDIPGKSTIDIYTELGELVKTISHTDGSGDQNWDLTTDANQLIVSGIYIAVIRDDDSGDQVIKKFVVIR